MADYGLEVQNRNGDVLFDSRTAGRGTFQYSKGSLLPGQTLSAKISDLVLVNIDRPSGGGSFLLLGTRTISGDDLDWVFSYGWATNYNQPINYVILRDAANAFIPPGQDYGLQCNDTTASTYSGSITGPVTFDTRMFNSSEGEITLNPNEVYFNPFSHGTYVSSREVINGTLTTGWNGPNGLDYYNAGVLDSANVSSYVRRYGLIWDSSTTTSNKIYSRQSGAYGSPPYSEILASIIYTTSLARTVAPSQGAVYSFQEIHSSGQGFENNTYPDALQPMFVGRPDPNLGLYEPTP